MTIATCSSPPSTGRKAIKLVFSESMRGTCADTAFTNRCARISGKASINLASTASKESALFQPDKRLISA